MTKPRKKQTKQNADYDNMAIQFINKIMPYWAPYRSSTSNNNAQPETVNTVQQCCTGVTGRGILSNCMKN